MPDCFLPFFLPSFLNFLLTGDLNSTFFSHHLPLGTQVVAAPYNDQMAVVVPISQAPPGLKVDDMVRLSNGLRAKVTEGKHP